MTGWLASLARHKGLKLLSLFLALVLWFAGGGEERTETTLNLNLELVNLSSNLMITGEVPPNRQVRVAGPRSIIRGLTQSRLVHTMDLAGVKPGSYTMIKQGGAPDTAAHLMVGDLGGGTYVVVACSGANPGDDCTVSGTGPIPGLVTGSAFYSSAGLDTNLNLTLFLVFP